MLQAKAVLGEYVGDYETAHDAKNRGNIKARNHSIIFRDVATREYEEDSKRNFNLTKIAIKIIIIVAPMFKCI